MNTASLLRVERLNYALGGVLVIVAALLRPQAEALGVAVGVALTCINFALLRRLIFRWTADAAAGVPSNRAFLMIPKMMGLMAAVGLSLWLIPMSAPAFAVGYSVFVASIAIDATYSLIAPAPADAALPADSPQPVADEATRRPS